ncbi:MAG TPA: RICIN domain-containing protein [Cytophagales bacterium]|nr:RICIN domain-containing protein [Cytophagales bacterium]
MLNLKLTLIRKLFPAESTKIFCILKGCKNHRSSFSLMLFLILSLFVQFTFAQTWSAPSVINDTPGNTEYGRMLKLTNGDWLSVVTINNTTLPGLDLQISRSTDNGRSWTPISMISESGREVDNGQMQLMPDGSILMSCRSVIWATSFRLPVYRSTDSGVSWTYLSTIDAKEGAAGTIGAQGMYEPHFNILDDGRLAVMYANEKHVTENPGYSQIISEKISSNGGATWGNEIFVAWEPAETAARPGMPVWTKMLDGRWIVAYEVCGPHNCEIYYKISNDGINWAQGLGTHLPGQNGAPYVLSASSGRLLLTSNNGNISISDNYGATWYNGNKPWGAATWPDLRWSSLYETGANEIAAVTSLNKSSGGSNVQVKFGTISGGPGSNLIVSGGVYKLVHKGTNQCLDVASNSAASGANVQQYTDNGSTAQRWVITLQSDGYFKLTHQGTNQVLDVDANSHTPGTNVQQWQDLNGDAQRWKIEPTGGGFFKLIHKGTNNCLDVVNNNSAPGTDVIVWTDNGDDAQRWSLVLTDVPVINGGTYKLTHKGTNQVLDVAGGSTAPGANVAQWFDLGGDPQKWIITLQEGGSYKLTHRGTTQVLDAVSNSNADGADVIQYNDIGGDAQRWILSHTGGGYFKLTHRNTNKCLDVSNGSSAPGANVQQWTDNGSDAQRWRLDLVPGSLGTGARISLPGSNESKGEILVYPNPFSNHVSINYTAQNEGSVKLQLLDAKGQTIHSVYEGNMKTGENKTFNIENPGLIRGLYFIKISDQNKVQLHKIMMAE